MAECKKKALPLKGKNGIIYAVEGNPSKTKKEIADEFGIASSTLSTVLRDKEKYKRLFHGGETTAKCKRLRSAHRSDVESELFRWFCFARSSNVPVNGPVLKAKAGEFAGSLGLDWKCTDSLTRFKHRHIFYKKLCGEAASVDTAATNAWTEDILKPALSRFRPQDVFNADESGLFWRLLPDKTLAFQS